MESEQLTIEVGGASYPAEMVSGVIRFKSNWSVRMIVDKGDDILNVLSREDVRGHSLREYAELYMLIGYSAGGFCDLPHFEHLEVKTHLWIRKGRRPWGRDRTSHGL